MTIEVWFFAWKVIWWCYYALPRRFLNFILEAEIWANFEVSRGRVSWFKNCQILAISRLLDRNLKIASVARNNFMQKIRLLSSLLWSSDMCGSKKPLLIFYSECFCILLRTNTNRATSFRRCASHEEFGDLERALRSNLSHCAFDISRLSRQMTNYSSLLRELATGDGNVTTTEETNPVIRRY